MGVVVLLLLLHVLSAWSPLVEITEAAAMSMTIPKVRTSCVLQNPANKFFFRRQAKIRGDFFRTRAIKFSIVFDSARPPDYITMAANGFLDADELGKEIAWRHFPDVIVPL